MIFGRTAQVFGSSSLLTLMPQLAYMPARAWRRVRTRAKPKPPRVLVVDDDALFRATLATVLAADGRVEVVGEAGDGASGVRRAIQLRPDLVLMDLDMPVMDGFEATRRIRQAVQAATVVAVSGSTAESDARDALAAGAAGFLSKAELGGELTERVLEFVK